MKKTFAVLFFVSLLSQAWAQTGLWTDGSQAPQRRVNVGAKALSPQVYSLVAESVSQAIVNVTSTRNAVQPARGPRGGQPIPSPFDEFFAPFFNTPNAPDRSPKQKGMGSGFVLTEDGYIATNNHVIEGADEIKVIFPDENEVPAKVVGRDAKTDVALLKIESKKKLRTVILGDSDAMKVGDVVVAIGNPFGLSNSVTQGIVSAKAREGVTGQAYDDFIQTDASINPGNSGGPLLNIQGEVIGINTAIVASGQGIGFAIPINLAKNILLKLKRDGRVIRGWLGVGIQKILPEHASALKLPSKEGALISDVQKGSPAERGGIQRGDVVVAFDGKPVRTWHDLPSMVADIDAGKTVRVDVIRDGSKRALDVKIEKLDEKESPAAPSQEPRVDSLGLRTEDVNRDAAKALGMEDTNGVLVTYVDPDAPASAKLRKRDVILEINRKKVSSTATYRSIVEGLKKGSDVLLLIQRQGTIQYIAFQL